VADDDLRDAGQQTEGRHPHVDLGQLAARETAKGLFCNFH
jgi:hypothetical protein